MRIRGTFADFPEPYELPDMLLEDKWYEEENIVEKLRESLRKEGYKKATPVKFGEMDEVSNLDKEGLDERFAMPSPNEKVVGGSLRWLGWNVLASELSGGGG